mmetsp:Transcript_5268/g.4929  ORF Transcript_5268/g.4929 Transcript_5268/m.4929 type:complete len:398 (-) Transcript_5268:502-1695(-)|eukprot:CAMPEP_0197829340 /NCGR_PEP_ID=MMETSP1437-20131217/5768_1 /TAXON_ID=49252 ORGANISM="Eucampia antarctica, Strain CCMP1452" /NCGR_SAMPLE_ID=MMETSP1437 /ASSEMBLY_ACC=CAM_ASM_001096 /LENGTH=397 /DNA_ID=CAMNT_0043430935 /DNA_START=127 /DNA_END=1320 /DNA_ORIENTATION=+
MTSNSTTDSSATGTSSSSIRRNTATVKYRDSYGIHAQVLSLPKEVRNLLAGGVAGMTAKSIVAPIDRIKIIYQVTSAPFYLRRVPKVAWNIVQTEGVAALWKGNTATMVRVFPYSGIQFMVFAKFKSYFLKQQQLRQHDSKQFPAEKRGMSPMESLLGGSCAGAVSVLMTYPLDLTRTQLAIMKKKTGVDISGNNKNKGFIDLLASNYRNGGMKGLFRGITPTFLGILPYSGIAFTINEQTKRRIEHVSGRNVTNVERVQCGALSGIVAQSMTYPLEVTRRRMQTIGIVPTSGCESAVNVLGGTVETLPASAAIKRVEGKLIENPLRKQRIICHNGEPPSMIRTVKELMREQGIRGFFKGVTMNWLKGPVAFSISFTIFDLLQGVLETDEERHQKNG